MEEERAADAGEGPERGLGGRSVGRLIGRPIGRAPFLSAPNAAERHDRIADSQATLSRRGGG